MFQLKRELYPVLLPQGTGFESKAVFNPGVVKKDGTVYMLYRAVGEFDTYTSRFGLATSKDNRIFTRISEAAVYTSHNGYARGGVEDPRIVWINGGFHVSYVAVPQQVLDHGAAPLHRDRPLITSGGLLTTTDFITFVDKGIMTAMNSDDKDVVLFPDKIGGRYAMLHRPHFWSQSGYSSTEAKAYTIELPCSKDDLPAKPAVWISYSDDLYHWDNHRIISGLLQKKDEKIGPGMPPLRTSKGWLIIYHQVQVTVEGKVYTAAAALLDLSDPSKVIARLPYSILRPETLEEKDGYIKNVVFPTGGFIEDGVLYVYYGAGDSVISLATGSIDELLAELDTYPL